MNGGGVGRNFMFVLEELFKKYILHIYFIVQFTKVIFLSCKSLII